MEHHNRFRIPRIHVLNIFLGTGSHRGEVYMSSSAKKQSLQQIASCLFFFFFPEATDLMRSVSLMEREPNSSWWRGRGDPFIAASHNFIAGQLSNRQEIRGLLILLPSCCLNVPGHREPRHPWHGPRKYFMLFQGWTWLGGVSFVVICHGVWFLLLFSNILCLFPCLWHFPEQLFAHCQLQLRISWDCVTSRWKPAAGLC